VKRRQWLIGGAALVAASALNAQPPRSRRVAYALAGTPGVVHLPSEAFKTRLGALGWVEGSTIEYVPGYARGDSKHNESMIAELLAHKPDVLVVTFGVWALLAKKLSPDVPIVFVVSSNPEKEGIVASLARPGGNITGVSTRERELLGKRIELLKEISPGMRRVAVLVNSNVPGTAKTYMEGYASHASKVGMELVSVDVRSADDLRPAFERMGREGMQGLLNVADAIQLQIRDQLVAQAARLRLIAVYVIEQFVEAGGLASYGTDLVDQWRRAAIYVDKILRGAKPADLPVEEPTHFHLALNLKAAREQRIKLPQVVLARADRVIE